MCDLISTVRSGQGVPPFRVGLHLTASRVPHVSPLRAEFVGRLPLRDSTLPLPGAPCVGASSEVEKQHLCASGAPTNRCGSATESRLPLF